MRPEYVRPDEKCFDGAIFMNTERFSYSRECQDQWHKFDRDCLTRWNDELCEKSYRDLDVNWNNEYDRKMEETRDVLCTEDRWYKKDPLCADRDAKRAEEEAKRKKEEEER